jgi:polar amino acid transport system substrate-binding protein
MSRTKKMLAFVLALVLVGSMALIGCSSGSATPPASTENTGSTGSTGSQTPANNELGLVKAGTLTVGSDCDYPPFIMLEDNKPTGFEYELAQALAQDMGLTLEYLSPQGFDTLVAAIAGGGKMDLAISSLTISDERKESIDFCDPYFDANQACVTLKSSSITSSADLAGKTVGAQSGTTGEAWANENIPGIIMKGFGQTSEGLAALQAGDIEALFFDEPVAMEQVTGTYTDCKILEVIPTGEQYGFGVSKDNPALKNQVNASLKKLIADGTYERLFAKYFPGAEQTVK